MRKVISASALIALLAMFGAVGAPGVSAGTGEATKVLDYETLMVSVNPDGSTRNVRLINTLTVHGTGNVVITDQMPTSDFRNLGGGGGPDVGDDTVTWNVENLEGSQQFVSQSTPDDEPPIGMRATYYLGDEQLPGEDMVGKSGSVQMVFDLSDLSAEQRQITYEDGSGKQLTALEDVVVPKVFQFMMELPAGHFSRLDAPGASVVTNPNGDLSIVWTGVFMPPIGGLTQSLSIAANTADFQLGEVNVTVMPLTPSQQEFIRFSQDDFRGQENAAAGAYTGVTGISESMDAVHEGTQQLVDGTKELLDGSQQLTTGLGEAFSGSGQLTSGLGDAFSGSGLISGGIKALRSGLRKILDGQKTLAAGLSGAVAGTQGIQDITDGLAAQIDTSIGGIMACVQLGGTPCPASPLPGNLSIADAASALAANAACAADAGCLALAGGLALFAHGFGANSIAGLNDLKACLTQVGGEPCAGNPSIKSIAAAIQAGLNKAIAGLGSAGDPNTLIGGTTAAVKGAGQLLDGSEKLESGLGRAFAGAGQLTAGLGRAFSGSGQITDGVRRVGDGIGSVEQSVYSINELGIKEISRSASETAGELARQIALMEAGEQRGTEEGMLYGPPSADQAEAVIGGEAVVLTMEGSGGGSASAARAAAILIGFLGLLGLGLIGLRGIKTPA